MIRMISWGAWSITVLTSSKRAAVVSYGGAGFSHELPCAAI